MNYGAQQDKPWTSGAGSQPPLLLTRRQQQGAIGIGALAGIAGGYAVFDTSNEAGTFMLLLISLIFLLLGLAGSPMMRRAKRGAGTDPARHGRSGLADTHPGSLADLMESAAVAEPSMIVVAEEDVVRYQADWPDDTGATG
jgi:hypothetical protein